MREQKLTESFGESAEPPCWDDGDVDPDEIVTLRDFRELWEPGTYGISGKSDQGEKSLDEDDDGNVFLDVAVEHWLPIIPAVGILWQF